jgi:DNA-binding NarL/FixJ family response regulator
MSTELALIQTASVLRVKAIYYDATEDLGSQIGHISNPKKPSQNSRARSRATLTPRERSVLIGLQAGLSLKEVASNLGISANTASTYKTRIMQKMKYQNNAQLLQGKD